MADAQPTQWTYLWKVRVSWFPEVPHTHQTLYKAGFRRKRTEAVLDNIVIYVGTMTHDPNEAIDAARAAVDNPRTFLVNSLEEIVHADDIYVKGGDV